MDGISKENSRKLKYADCYRGTSYHRLGQYQRAIEDYDKAIELDPSRAEEYNNLKMLIV